MPGGGGGVARGLVSATVTDPDDREPPEVVVDPAEGDDEYTQSVFVRTWDQVAGRWVYRLLPE